MRSHLSGAAMRACATAVFSLVVPLMGESASSARVFNAPLEATWNAAVEVAGEAFLADRISNHDSRLRLRAGPLRAYAFDVLVQDAGDGKTRVGLTLRTSSAIPAVKKDAQRNADRYFGLLRNRVEQRGRK
jgi:hypothetical protein